MGNNCRFSEGGAKDAIWAEENDLLCEDGDAQINRSTILVKLMNVVHAVISLWRGDPLE